ncbi:MAG: helix-turn-helix domain-containing protein [Bacteroidia bacterium]|nr:helix-turn-helix domain-containing protein [Bacteroidia bacterium]
MVIIQLTTDELTSLVKRAVRDELNAHKPNGNSNNEARDQIGRVGFAMQLTGLAQSTIYQKVQRNEIPFSRRGKHLYFSRQDLEAWLMEERERTVNELGNEAMNGLIEKNKGRKK